MKEQLKSTKAHVSEHEEAQKAYEVKRKNQILLEHLLDISKGKRVSVKCF